MYCFAAELYVITITAFLNVSDIYSGYISTIDRRDRDTRYLPSVVVESAKLVTYHGWWQP